MVTDKTEMPALVRARRKNTMGKGLGGFLSYLGSGFGGVGLGTTSRGREAGPIEGAVVGSQILNQMPEHETEIKKRKSPSRGGGDEEWK